jgi:hypothetical protein
MTVYLRGNKRSEPLWLGSASRSGSAWSPARVGEDYGRLRELRYCPQLSHQPQAVVPIPALHQLPILGANDADAG